jgi:hypothetical protein
MVLPRHVSGVGLRESKTGRAEPILVFRKTKGAPQTQFNLRKSRLMADKLASSDLSEMRISVSASALLPVDFHTVPADLSH